MTIQHYVQVERYVPVPCECFLSSIREILMRDQDDAVKISIALAMIDGWGTDGWSTSNKLENRQPPPITTTGVQTTWTKPSVGTELVGVVTKIYAPEEE